MQLTLGVFRKEFAFEKWADFDQELFDMIYNDDSQEREFKHHIFGYDTDMKAVNTARMNVAAAGFSRDITIEQQDFKDFSQPKEKSIIVMNPPYGERISTPNLKVPQRSLADSLGGVETHHSNQVKVWHCLLLYVCSNECPDCLPRCLDVYLYAL